MRNQGKETEAIGLRKPNKNTHSSAKLIRRSCDGWEEQESC